MSGCDRLAHNWSYAKILSLGILAVTMVACWRCERFIAEVATAVAVVTLQLSLTTVRTLLVTHSNPPICDEYY
jgi:hypothetical protein